MAKRAANLVRRNGTYYFRCRVPDDLRPVLAKREIYISLRTKDYSEGRKLAAGIRYAVLAGFEGIRMGKSDNPRNILRDMGLNKLVVPVPPAPKDIGFDTVDLAPEMDKLAQETMAATKEANAANDALIRVINIQGTATEATSATHY